MEGQKIITGFSFGRVQALQASDSSPPVTAADLCGNTLHDAANQIGISHSQICTTKEGGKSSTPAPPPIGATASKSVGSRTHSTPLHGAFLMSNFDLAAVEKMACAIGDRIGERLAESLTKALSGVFQPVTAELRVTNQAIMATNANVAALISELRAKQQAVSPPEPLLHAKPPTPSDTFSLDALEVNESTLSPTECIECDANLEKLVERNTYLIGYDRADNFVIEKDDIACSAHVIDENGTLLLGHENLIASAVDNHVECAKQDDFVIDLIDYDEDIIVGKTLFTHIEENTCVDSVAKGVVYAVGDCVVEIEKKTLRAIETEGLLNWKRVRFKPVEIVSDATQQQWATLKQQHAASFGRPNAPLGCYDRDSKIRISCFIATVFDGYGLGLIVEPFFRAKYEDLVFEQNSRQHMVSSSGLWEVKRVVVFDPGGWLAPIRWVQKFAPLWIFKWHHEHVHEFHFMWEQPLPRSFVMLVFDPGGSYDAWLLGFQDDVLALRFMTSLLI